MLLRPAHAVADVDKAVEQVEPERRAERYGQGGGVTAIVTDEDAATIMTALERTPELPVTVDLEQQTIACGNQTYSFIIDPVRRRRLLNGWDEIAVTQSFRKGHNARVP
jgi:3-isopropylmalate/(R)-2-methylmalate dehydratase small subunit